MLRLSWVLPFLAGGCVSVSLDLSLRDDTNSCAVELIVLGAGQDAGAPQIGNHNDPAWNAPELKLFATSLGIVDHRASQRFLFEATPHITDQLHLFDQRIPSHRGDGALDGVFVTHAHIGHYAGLMFFGREAAGAAQIPVYTMPRLANYLRENGPWEQLVALENISINVLADQAPIALTPRASVTPLRVPHRDEYSETVGFIIEVSARETSKRVLFIPDIDDWDEWTHEFGHSIESLVAGVDYAFVDATFFDDDELPGRDMSKIPHPRVSDTMMRLRALPSDIRAGVHFIHYNHTNPIRFKNSPETQQVESLGFKVARRGDLHCLDEND